MGLFLFCYITGRQELVTIQSGLPQQQEKRGAAFLLGSLGVYKTDCDLTLCGRHLDR